MRLALNVNYALTHRSVHLQENGPKVSLVEVQVNSCKTKATVIRKTWQRSNFDACRQNKNNRTDETSGWLISLTLSSSLFWRWSRVFCLAVYSTHALAQHLHVHMSHWVHRTTTIGIRFFAENISCSHFQSKNQARSKIFAMKASWKISSRYKFFFYETNK